MQVRGGRVDNGRMGKFPVLDQDVTQVHATGNKTYHPLKRITGLSSSSTIARRLRSTTRIS